MVNTDLLESKIADSGLTKTWLAQRLGISIQCFRLKCHNQNDFKLSEAMILRKALNLSKTEFESIFFAS